MWSVLAAALILLATTILFLVIGALGIKNHSGTMI